MNTSITAAGIRRIGANLAALAVGGVAARATWAHIVHVGQKYGETMAAWLPVSIDGMMIAGVILSVDAKVTGKPVNPWARAATWIGGVMSVSAQIESGRERGWVAALIATVFSITLIVTVEAVAWSGKTKRSAAPVVPVVEAAQQVVAQSMAALPVPVSPAPRVSTERVTPGRSGPSVVGPSKASPLTGRVLMQEPPKV